MLEVFVRKMLSRDKCRTKSHHATHRRPPAGFRLSITQAEKHPSRRQVWSGDPPLVTSEVPVPAAPPASSSLGGRGITCEVGRKGVPASGSFLSYPLSFPPFLKGSGVSKKGDGPPLHPEATLDCCPERVSPRTHTSLS